MPHAFTSLEYDEDLPIKSSTWQPDMGTETLSSVVVTLSNANLYTVLGLVKQPATGFIAAPSALPFAWFQFGPSRLGLSNRTQTYSLEFVAEDTLGFKFASIIGVKVNKTGW